MQGLEQLKELAEKLPKEVQANAINLVTRMGEVIEGIGDRPVEWRPSNLRVVQPSSDRSKLPKGTPIGAILFGEEVAQQPLKTIPFSIWNARQYWSPDKDEARMICSSPDAVFGYIGKYCKDCDYGTFNKELNRSECNKVKTVMSITADLSTIFTANFSKTNYMNGSDWEKLMKKAGVAPYKKIYQLQTQTNSKYKNVESLTVETHNENTPEAYLPFLEALFTKIRADKETYKINFYEMVKNKTASMALLGSSEDDVPAVLVAPQAESNDQQSSMAKKYQM